MTQIPSDLALRTSAELEHGEAPIVALLPVGATEQHGPNLAIGTDTRAAERIAGLLAERLGSRAVALPALPYGLSEHHMGFRGTLSIGPDAVLAVLRDVARSAHRQGVRMLMFVNGHNGNTAILNVAANAIRYEVGIETASMFYFKQAADVIREASRTPRFGHACEIETSVMLHLDEAYVRRDALVPGDMIPHERLHADNTDPFSLYAPVPFDRQTRNGAFGDARYADEEVGRRIVDTALDRTVAFVDTFLAEIA
ncbi:MAG: creatininase family protein [Trueperaceae bacterium]|nr:creatininase family protein [Trueperaceae bacterium]